MDECLYFASCGQDCENCEYYTPLDLDAVIQREYQEWLDERVNEYNELLAEMDDA